MNLTRRGLLRALPALPLAGNEIKRRAAELAGVNVLGPGLGPMTAQGVSTSDPTSTVLHGRPLAMLLKTLGLPWWKRRELRMEAQYSRQLDPDLASLRSVSLSSALAIQWKRNERRAEERMWFHMESETDRRNFRDKHSTGWF